MDLNEQLRTDSWTKSSSSKNELPRKVPPNHLSYLNFNVQQHQQKWEDPSQLDYSMFPELNQHSETPSSIACNSNVQIQIPSKQDDTMSETCDVKRVQDWDPRAMLSNLSFLEQKIHQLQNLVHVIVGQKSRIMGQSDEFVAQQQQLITVDVTSIIVQLISTAGSLLPFVKHNLSVLSPVIGQFGGVAFPSEPCMSDVPPQNSCVNKVENNSSQIDVAGNCGTEQNFMVEELELKDEEDVDDGENLPPGSYEILQLEKEEILAPHTHFCTICGKGFKRDANLRMHMRGHGDEYKTPEALAKPHKESNSEPMLTKRYSCPFSGCKRNKDHKKFQPLKTILCVKNHYKRTHCDKSYICSRCNTKKFSVIADLKTHEKHCGRDKWICSCGTTFSRKDKLFGHIALFQGHTPAIPVDEAKGSAGLSDREVMNETSDKVGTAGFNCSSSVCCGAGVETGMDKKDNIDNQSAYFSPFNGDVCNLNGFHEFPRPSFEDTESSFSFLISGSSSYSRKPEEAAFKHLE